MRRAVAAAALIGLYPAAAPARAPVFQFQIPAGTLQTAIVAVGETAGVSIGLTDQSLGRTRLPAFQGRFDVADALARLLKGTGAGFVQIDGVAFQIVRSEAAIKRSGDRSSLSAQGDAEILVTGSKRAASLQNYPGSVNLIDTDALPPNDRPRGSDALIAQLPILASTHLGPGRDKLFIRGIADSSFAGPTQATVGQYLGDVRLNYNAPDPDLALYDIRSVEVIEGPQGTLYGSGSLGGIIRLEPAAPDLWKASLDLSFGGSQVAHGAAGADAAAIGNLPLVSGRLALRVVSYGNTDGGYINDVGRDLRDINRTVTRGVRVTLRWQPSDRWTIYWGGIVQDINSRDGQYALRGLPPLSRASAIAGPFDNDYGLASLVLRHTWGDTALISASSFVSHEIETTYDATVSPTQPMRYESTDSIAIYSNETRLSHHGSGGVTWVAGVALLRSEDRLARILGPAGGPATLPGTSNIVEDASIYGEATVPISSSWSVTAGGRAGYSRQVGEVRDQPGHPHEPHRHDLSELPSLALLWHPKARLSLYARYQEGYRPGGLSVQAQETLRFEADSVATWEIGVRLGTDADRFSASAAVSYAHWENIQADLVDAAGLPYTANIGTGHVLALESRATWRPEADLRLDGALFVNQSRLSHPAPAFAGEEDATLPDVPTLIGRAAATYMVAMAGHHLDLSASLRYVGRSRLGVGPLLDLPQGNYIDTAAGASIGLGWLVVSLNLTNLLDTHGDIFALGNPFGVTARRQITPLRPRTIRLGFSTHF